jgi:hypothetical protein
MCKLNKICKFVKAGSSGPHLSLQEGPSGLLNPIQENGFNLIFVEELGESFYEFPHCRGKEKLCLWLGPSVLINFAVAIRPEVNRLLRRSYNYPIFNADMEKHENMADFSDLFKIKYHHVLS